MTQNRHRGLLLIFFMTINICTTAFYIYKSNPKILLNTPLFETLTKKMVDYPIPSREFISSQLQINPKKLQRKFFEFSQNQPHIALPQLRVGKRFRKNIELYSLDSPPLNWFHHSEFYYFVHKQKIIKRDSEFNIIWAVETPDIDTWAPELYMIGPLIIAYNSNNEIYAINASSGQIVWLRTLSFPLVSPPFINKNDIVIFSAQDKKLKAMAISAFSGDTTASYNHFEIGSFKKIYTFNNQALVMVSDNLHQLHLFHYKSGKRFWTHKAEAPLHSTPLLKFGNLYFSDDNGLVTSLNFLKGELLWSYKLSNPPASRLSFVPEYKQIAVMVSNGYLHTIDIKSGDGSWRFNTRNESSFSDVFSVRMNNSVIDESKMPWGKKGWTIWTPCVKDRLCIFNPKNGQIIGRIWARGRPLSRPSFENNQSFVMAIQPLKKEKRTKAWILNTYEKYKKKPSAPTPKPEAE